MKRKILKTVLLAFILFAGFSLYMSPSLGGLIQGGKDEPEKIVEKLKFENTRNLDLQINYQTFTEIPI